jgi:hypothetical protein
MTGIVWELKGKKRRFANIIQSTFLILKANRRFFPSHKDNLSFRALARNLILGFK